jgi:hypothetical protein
MLSTAAPFQGTKQPDFLSIKETADVMTPKPSAASHMHTDSWCAFSFLLSIISSAFVLLVNKIQMVAFHCS